MEMRSSRWGRDDGLAPAWRLVEERRPLCLTPLRLLMQISFFVLSSSVANDGLCIFPIQPSLPTQKVRPLQAA